MDAVNGLKVGSLVKYKATLDRYDKLGVIVEVKSESNPPVGKLYSREDNKWVDGIYSIAWQDGSTSVVSDEYWQRSIELLS